MYSSYSDVLHCSGGSCNGTEFPCYLSCQDGSLGNIAQETGLVFGFLFVHGRKYLECSGEHFCCLRSSYPVWAAQQSCREAILHLGVNAFTKAGFHPNSHWRGNGKNSPKGKCHCVLLGKALQNQFVSLFLKWCWAELEVLKCQIAFLRQLCLVEIFLISLILGNLFNFYDNTFYFFL